MLGTRCLGIALTSLLIVYDASALSLDSQSRVVFVQADVVLDGIGSDSSSDSDSAPGIGPFVSSISTGASVGTNLAIGVASQDTSLMVMPGSIWGDGGGGALADFDVFDPGFPGSSALGFGSSGYIIDFTVLSNTPFTFTYLLSAELQTFGGNATLIPQALWALEGANQGLVDSDQVLDFLADGNLVEVFDVRSGFLTPDSYTFTIGALADGGAVEDGFASGIAAYNFEIHLPEPSTGLMLGLGLGLVVIALHRRRSCGPCPAVGVPAR